MTSPSTFWTQRYWSALRKNVHQLIVWGYNDALPQIITLSGETDITGLISEAIEARLSAPNRPKWCGQLSIKEDTPVPGGGRTGRKRKRPDIIIQSTKVGHPEFIFEAKRLSKNGHGEDKYIGAGGMLCFLRGEYAQRFSEGVMLGYVQSHSVGFWMQKIRSAIDTDTKNILDLVPPQINQMIIADFPDEWLSVHKRPNNTDIGIYHIIVDCYTPPSTAPATMINSTSTSQGLQ